MPSWLGDPDLILTSSQLSFCMAVIRNARGIYLVGMSLCWYCKLLCVRRCPDAFSSSFSPALLPSKPTTILLPGFCSVHLPTTAPVEDPPFSLTVRYATHRIPEIAQVSPCSGNGHRLYVLQIQKQRWTGSHFKLGCAWISYFPSPSASSFPCSSALWTSHCRYTCFCCLVLQVSFSVSYNQSPGSAQLATDVSKPSARFLDSVLNI